MHQQPAFGRRLRTLRTARGLSQAALAGDGMSTGYLSRLETGARRPTGHAVAYLARRLGIRPADFEAPAAGSLTDALTLAASTGSDDAVRALGAALAAADSHERPVLRWQALWTLARARRLHGDHSGERTYLASLVGLGEETGLAELRVRGLTRYARCLRSLGDLAPAERAALTAHRLARTAGLGVDDRALALLALVSVESEAGRLPDARAHADELTALLEGRTDALWAQAMWTAAAVRVRQGHHSAARACLDQALERFDSAEDLVLWLRLRLAAARLHLDGVPARPKDARRCAKAAESALAFVGTPALRQELTALKADLAFRTGHHDQARRLLAELAGQEPRLTYRDRVRLDVLRHRLLVLAGDEAGLAGLRALAEQARADANLDLAAEIWQLVADTLTRATAGR